MKYMAGENVRNLPRLYFSPTKTMWSDRDANSGPQRWERASNRRRQKSALKRTIGGGGKLCGRTKRELRRRFPGRPVTCRKTIRNLVKRFHENIRIIIRSVSTGELVRVNDTFLRRDDVNYVRLS